MLAKQVWRLLENKNSLFHRFFKEKFFPNGNIFTAKGGCGSFAWKSILIGREVIKKGAIWRVRNGENILIYQDRWLPAPQHTNIQSPPNFFGCDAQVSVLIDKENRCWIDDTVDNNFNPHEARMIKSIPLCLTDGDDKLFWPSMVDGAYSVKAGYRFLVDAEQVPNVSPLPPSHQKSFWKGLWKLKVPNRIKTLLWRAISDALPTRLNLVKRKVLNDATCQLCGLV